MESEPKTPVKSSDLSEDDALSVIQSNSVVKVLSLTDQQQPDSHIIDQHLLDELEDGFSISNTGGVANENDLLKPEQNADSCDLQNSGNERVVNGDISKADEHYGIISNINRCGDNSDIIGSLPRDNESGDAHTNSNNHSTLTDIFGTTSIYFKSSTTNKIDQNELNINTAGDSSTGAIDESANTIAALEHSGDSLITPGKVETDSANQKSPVAAISNHNRFTATRNGGNTSATSVKRMCDNDVDSGVTPRSIKTVIFFDLETTSLDRPRITEISMVGMLASRLVPDLQTDGKDGLPRVMSKLTLQINPGRLIHYKAAEVSGLWNDMLNHLPTYKRGRITQQIEQFLTASGPPPYCFIAHNGSRFDFPVLRSHIDSLPWSPEFPSDQIFVADSITAIKELDSEMDVPMWLPAREAAKSDGTPDSSSGTSPVGSADSGDGASGPGVELERAPISLGTPSSVVVGVGKEGNATSESGRGSSVATLGSTSSTPSVGETSDSTTVEWTSVGLTTPGAATASSNGTTIRDSGRGSSPTSTPDESETGFHGRDHHSPTGVKRKLDFTQATPIKEPASADEFTGVREERGTGNGSGTRTVSHDQCPANDRQEVGGAVGDNATGESEPAMNGSNGISDVIKTGTRGRKVVGPVGKTKSGSSVSVHSKGKPKLSYKLGEIYKRLFPRSSVEFHRAENDVVAMVQICRCYRGFGDWMNQNATRFDDVKPRAI